MYDGLHVALSDGHTHFLRAVVRPSHTDFLSLIVVYADDVVGFKLPLVVCDADGEYAGGLLALDFL